MRSALLIRSMLLGAALLAVSALPAQAGFEFIPAPTLAPEPQEPMDAPPSARDSWLNESGAGSFGVGEPIDITGGDNASPAGMIVGGSGLGVDTSAPVETGGTAVPLALALQRIAPASLQLAFDPSVDLATSVSWRSGAPWRTTMRLVLEPLNLVATESGDVLRIAPPAAPLVTAALDPLLAGDSLSDVSNPLSFEVADGAAMQVVGLPGSQLAQAGGDSFGVPTSSTDDSITRAWIVEQGRTLREVLEIWGDAAGWTVVWDTERDYLIEASATLMGDSRTASGDLLRSFATASPPIIATFYRNRTLVIETQSDGDLD